MEVMKNPRNNLLAAFAMTREEKKMLALVAFVTLVGVAARYVYLRNRKPEPYMPANMPTNFQQSTRPPVVE